MRQGLLNPMREQILKACKDCKHVGVSEDNKTIICLHDQVAKELVDYYRGIVVLARPSVEIARTIGECKEEAIYFEPKN